MLINRAKLLEDIRLQAEELAERQAALDRVTENLIQQSRAAIDESRDLLARSKPRGAREKRGAR
jgi:hypothetical protein